MENGKKVASMRSDGVEHRPRNSTSPDQSIRGCGDTARTNKRALTNKFLADGLSRLRFGVLDFLIFDFTVDDHVLVTRRAPQGTPCGRQGGKRGFSLVIQDTGAGVRLDRRLTRSKGGGRGV